MSHPSDPPADGADSRPIHPDIDWQAGLLAGKVLRQVMSLAAATEELAAWQEDALSSGAAYRPVDARALIVTHMMNRLLARGY